MLVSFRTRLRNSFLCKTYVPTAEGKLKSSHPLAYSSSAGHDIGTVLGKHIKQSADIHSFLFAQLEIKAGRRNGCVTIQCLVPERSRQSVMG